MIHYVPFAGTCTAWRQLLLGNQTWWRAWCDHRWCASTELLACDSGNTSHEHLLLNDDWQQYALTRGLHIPWRYKPVNPRRLLYCVGRQVLTLQLQLTAVTCMQLVSVTSLSWLTNLATNIKEFKLTGQKIQDGWDRRGHPPAVLVEGDWALLTCTPGRAGPSGGRDRLQLIKLKSSSKTQKQQAWPLC